MFFTFSKLLISFLSPFTWIIILFVAGLLIKNPNRKRKCFLAAGILLIIFTNPLLLSLFAKKWDAKPAANETGKKYSAVIVLGGFVAEDANAQGYFSNSSDRFIQAMKLKNSGVAENILFTGGSGRLFPTAFREADWLLNEAKAFNVADSNIIIENRSRNTLENAKFAQQLLDSLKMPPPYLLVTSAFHMRRALYVFNKAGIDVIPHPANYFAGRDKISLSSFVPDASALSTWDIYIKEVVGLLVYKIKG